MHCLWQQRAADAQRRNDWAGAAAALEARIAAGEATDDMWLALARAQQRRTPPDPAHAARAGWQAFRMADTRAPEIPEPLAMAEALRRSLNLPAVALLDAAGPLRFAEALHAAGAKPRLPAGADPALPLALGGAGLTMREMAGLYAGLVASGSGPVRLLPGGPFFG